ncbi:response regulator [Bryobacter aggregatus]|uniref:response regulator n=1 Tax=Bryobacter aggregatus TaxID=360054 RepID=UPI0004E0D8D3|nr:response regulator transcription factor [Bryobacter aggregatus]
MPIRILLADDHAILRRGLRALLERESDMEVLGEAADGRETVEAVDRLAPDVVVLDIAMPNLNGIEATRQIAAKTAVIVLSMHSDESYVLRALRAGAKGYLIKDTVETELIRAIEAVATGKAYFSPEVSRLLVEDYVNGMRERGIDDSLELLTAREREVLQMLAEGKTVKDIARSLELSVYTVDTHKSNLMQKLGLHSMAELILYAVRKGIIR